MIKEELIDITMEKILGFLKGSTGYISGEEISSRLKISRQALWKHIQELRDIGYDIVAVPHLGYRLVSCPDRLNYYEVTSGLNTKFIGRKTYYFDTIPTTIDIISQLAMKGAAEGTIVIAESQTKGRGRLGRSWFSPKYKGIYMSLILRPAILPNQAPLLTLMSAVSVCEAIKEKADLTCSIKWPNDILIHHKKVGGILTELNAETDLSRFVIVSIGLNVNNDKKTILSGATSLREQKKQEVSRLDILQEILRKIEENYLTFQKNGGRFVVDKWREWNITLGRRVRVICQKEHIEGHAVDIDTDGGLLIRTDSGLRRKVMSGDVVHCR